MSSDYEANTRLLARTKRSIRREARRLDPTKLTPAQRRALSRLLVQGPQPFRGRLADGSLPKSSYRILVDKGLAEYLDGSGCRLYVKPSDDWQVTRRIETVRATQLALGQADDQADAEKAGKAAQIKTLHAATEIRQEAARTLQHDERAAALLEALIIATKKCGHDGFREFYDEYHQEEWNVSWCGSSVVEMCEAEDDTGAHAAADYAIHLMCEVRARVDAREQMFEQIQQGFEQRYSLDNGPRCQATATAIDGPRPALQRCVLAFAHEGKHRDPQGFTFDDEGAA